MAGKMPWSLSMRNEAGVRRTASFPLTPDPLTFQHDCQCVDGQRFDKHQTEDECKPDSSRGSRIPSDRFRGAPDGVTLADAAEATGDSQPDHAAEKFHFSGSHAAAGSLRKDRTGRQDQHDKQQEHHFVSHFIVYLSY